MAIKRWYGVADPEKRYGAMTFGMFLRAFREADRLSQCDFARDLDLSKANLCDLEKGRKIPSPERAAKIAAKLGVGKDILIKLALQDALRLAKLNYKVELKAA